VEQAVGQVWPVGLVRIVVRADAMSSPGDEHAGSIEREVWLWAVPWPHLIVVAGAALLVAGLLWRRRRQRAEVEERIEQARRETADAMRAEFESVR
jgi:MYXO-CTERM domain-containing protein